MLSPFFDLCYIALLRRRGVDGNPPPAVWEEKSDYRKTRQRRASTGAVPPPFQTREAWGFPLTPYRLISIASRP
jgi:hypothetical protein